MKNILVSNDIIPVGQFKSGLAKYLKEIQNKRNSLIITQNGKPAGVLISPSEFDELRQTKLFIDSISRGLSDSEKGEVLSTSQLRIELQKTRTGKERRKYFGQKRHYFDCKKLKNTSQEIIPLSQLSLLTS
mgnify:CR=1 FL=1